jgi:hypothetical protein
MAPHHDPRTKSKMARIAQHEIRARFRRMITSLLASAGNFASHLPTENLTEFSFERKASGKKKQFPIWTDASAMRKWPG